MDSEAMLALIRQQTEMLRIMAEKVQNQTKNEINIPLPSPLSIDKDIVQNFEYFVKSWHNYTVACGMDQWSDSDENKKVHTLLTAIGEKAMNKYNHFNLSENDKQTCEKVIKAIRNFLKGKKNVIYERAVFNSTCQHEEESFDEYLIKLQELIETCEYGAFRDDLLRDRIVIGIKNRDIRKKLLTKPDLTLEQTIDICKIDEVTVQRLKNLEQDESKSINKIEKKQFLKICKFCGNKHKFIKGSCPAYGKNCNKCGGKNHFEKVCKREKRKNMNKTNKKIKEIINETDDSENLDEDDTQEQISEIRKILDNSSNGGNVKAELDFIINKKLVKVTCDIDTGANVCIIGYKQLGNLFKDVKLKNSNHKLYGIGGNEIQVVGEKTITCRHGKTNYDIIFQVVKINHGPLLSANACSKLGLIKFCNMVKMENSKHDIYELEKEAESIVEKYKDVFQGYGCLEGEVDLDLDRTVQSVIQKARRIPVHLRERLKQELDSLVKNKIIAKVEKHTDWVSNILLVNKKDKLRICLDPIPLNKALLRPRMQFTTIDEILPELGKAKVFSTMDAKKGFWQVKLSETSSNLTTFWTPFGRYKWLRMPFGIAPAPEIFQNKMYSVLNGLKGIEILADDILIIGCGDNKLEALKDHNDKLEKLLQCLRESNCKLNKDKMNLCKSTVNFYGHVLTDNGIKPDEVKIQAIKNFPEPQNKKELHRFLGMITYLSRYIKNLSSEVHNLRYLIRENTEWRWTDIERREFEKIKETLIKTTTLKYFEKGKPLTIECDASNYGLGTALYQDDKVIGFASRTLTKTEANYAQIEKEMLAIVFACIRFDQLIIGNSQTIIKTDHKPLINIFNKPLLSVPKRLQKMLMTLQRYNLNFNFVVGKENMVADALSRAPLQSTESSDNTITLSTICKLTGNKICKFLEDTDLTSQVSISEERLKEIRTETEKDFGLQKIRQYILSGWPNTIQQLPDEVKRYNAYKYNLSYQNGIIYKDNRILIPFKIRKNILQRLHMSHSGIDGTLSLARRNIFWPGMTTEIKNKIKECSICTEMSYSQCKLPMQTHPIPEYPFQYVSLDVLTTNYKGKKRYFLVTIDHYSDYFELNILNNLSAKNMVEICKENFSRHGIPQRLCTDNATNFTGKEFQDFIKQWDIFHVTSSPHYAQSNGKAEATVKIAKQLICKTEKNNEDLWLALLHHRNISNKIGTSPVQRLFARNTRTLIPSATKNYLPEIVKNVSEKIETNKQQYKTYYDKRTKYSPTLNIGQPVAAQLNPEMTKKWTPGSIENKLSDRSYVVNIDGNKYRRNIVHLKPMSPTITSQQATVSHPTYDTNLEKHKDPDELSTAPSSPEKSNNTVKPATPKPTSVCTSIPKKDTSTSRKSTEPTKTCVTDNIIVRPKRDRKVPIKFKDYV